MNNEDAVAKYNMENDCFTTRNLLQEEKPLDKYEAMRNDIINLQHEMGAKDIKLNELEAAMKHMNNEDAGAKDGMENYCLTLCNTLQEEKLKNKFEVLESKFVTLDVVQRLVKDVGVKMVAVLGEELGAAFEERCTELEHRLGDLERLRQRR